MIFISAPYSHADKRVIEERYRRICLFCADQLIKGKIVISPVVYGHALVENTHISGDSKTWQGFCKAVLSSCEQVYVLKLPGWDESTGVADEIRAANDLNIDIRFIQDNEVPK